MITIPEFFNNRDIFITGGTGFVGKVLIEKLLRSCPIKRIFLMLRAKRSKSINERLEEIKNTPLFDKIKNTNPDVLDKLIAVEGDVSMVGLGFTDETRKLLENVSVIFHSAASVRFDDNLKSAIILNTRGTHEVIKFAVTLSHLASFVHVSTTYCYPDEPQTNEKTYPAHGDWRKAIAIAENVDTELLECLMPHFTAFSPNSYTYTKALAEQICKSYEKLLPITIVRPSIVTGTENEPMPGWVDNFNGPVGLLTACGIGIMRTMYASKMAELNCVAVDIVSKTLIVASWKCAIDNRTVERRNESNENLNDMQLSVYNCASLHNMTLDLLVYDGKYLIRKHPFERSLWVPGGGVTLCKFMNFWRIICFQLLPAAIVDEVLKAQGKAAFLMKLQRKIAHVTCALKTFIFSKWNFGTENFLALNKILLPSDVDDFHMRRIVTDDYEYYISQMQGARKFLLKEPETTIPASKRRMMIMLIIDRLMRILFLALLAYWLLKEFNFIGSFRNVFCNDTIVRRQLIA